MCIKKKSTSTALFTSLTATRTTVKYICTTKKRQNIFLRSQERSSYNDRTQHSKREKTDIFDKKHIKEMQQHNSNQLDEHSTYINDID